MTDVIFEKLLDGYEIVIPHVGTVRLERRKTNHSRYQRVDPVLSIMMKRKVVKQNVLTDGYYPVFRCYNNPHSKFRLQLKKKFRQKLADHYNANPHEIHKLLNS